MVSVALRGEVLYIRIDSIFIFVLNIEYIHLFQIRTRILMDFASASGQNVLLVGPPGSGKTTLINDFMDFQSSKYKISLQLTNMLFTTFLSGPVLACLKIRTWQFRTNGLDLFFC